MDVMVGWILLLACSTAWSRISVRLSISNEEVGQDPEVEYDAVSSVN